MRYIALLRGVNVGGNNKISMKELKARMEQVGFMDVATYINSGNVLFTSNRSADENKCAIEQLIKDTFSLTIFTAVIPADDAIQALLHAPEWWGQDPDSKHNAIFVLPPATAEEIMQQVGEAKPEYEKIANWGNVIFWSAPVLTFSRTRWSKIVGTSAYDSITIRNANTVRQLAKLCIK